MQKQEQVTNQTRRNLIAGAAGAATLLAASPLLGKDMHDHHSHGASNNQLVDSALHCVAKGEACIEHCIQSFHKGDTELSHCMETAREAVEACKLLATYGAGNSPHLAKLAGLCIDVCETCAKECKKHAKKHSFCKECMDSCNDCIQACKKVA